MEWPYIHCCIVQLYCACPGQRTMCPSGSPQVLTSSLQVSTTSDFQPYMDQFVAHLQGSGDSTLRNSVVIEQVLRLPIHGPYLVGPCSSTLLFVSGQECDQHAPWWRVPMTKATLAGGRPHDMTKAPNSY